jgi:mRNA-degrading endonuclease RelE of RelBE toxin-antitoxin system
MNSATLPSFWELYRQLDPNVKARVKKAYRLWADEPFHPSLRFKCINPEESIWSVRVTRGYRALGLLDQNTVTWFWIGSHDEYERFFG